MSVYLRGVASEDTMKTIWNVAWQPARSSNPTSASTTLAINVNTFLVDDPLRRRQLKGAGGPAWTRTTYLRGNTP
jgi:hypothetical protein